MESANVRRSLSTGVPRRRPWGSTTLLMVSGIFVASLAAQTPNHSANPEPAAAASSDAPAQVLSAPNYALEARFLPDSMNKLVFDLSVTPHWFTLSDRFWYSYRTTDGTKYYIVDPVKKSKSPLWDNAKIAAALWSMTMPSSSRSARRMRSARLFSTAATVECSGPSAASQIVRARR